MIHVKSLISMAQISYIFKKFPTVLKVSKEGECWVTEKEESGKGALVRARSRAIPFQAGSQTNIE